MKLDVKATALTGAIVWGGIAIFLTGLVNILWSGYGQGFLEAVASLYPGYDATASFGQVVVGALYGALDGGVVGAITAWLYNRLAKA